MPLDAYLATSQDWIAGLIRIWLDVRRADDDFVFGAILMLGLLEKIINVHDAR